MDSKLFFTVFSTVFLAEVIDKTQLATMLFSAKNPSSALLVFAASATALVTACAIGVVSGSLLSRYLDPRILSWIAGAGFIVIGVWTLAKA